MLLIVGTVRLPAHNLEAARPIMQRMAEASRAEEGCAEYSYAEDLFDPGLIHVKEMWVDQHALDRHSASGRMASGMAGPRHRRAQPLRLRCGRAACDLGQPLTALS
ncbi:putative quinol monooxygenase [Aurantiacibacter flavus]|uniref:Quinol monooxygenase n=1 Tax=Aurantiacibacter flavus TaxID=3145232 RepID=A0ABV0CVT6_9SPHN